MLAAGQRYIKNKADQIKIGVPLLEIHHIVIIVERVFSCEAKVAYQFEIHPDYGLHVNIQGFQQDNQYRT